MRRLLLTAACLAATTGFAAAQEDAFLGRWRITGAEPAPWVGLGRAPTPLLRTGLVISERGLLGAHPLRCDDARLERVTVPPEGLFQGGLAPETAGERAAALGFPGDAIPTLRIACSAGLFDIHKAGPALKLALDNVIYTLERQAEVAEPVRDDTFIARAAPSFPCHQARRAAERVVCAHDEAGAADGLMAASYARVAGLLPPGAAADALRTSQRAFLAHMERVCVPGGRPPSDDGARQAAGTCLTDHLRARTRQLDGMADAPGPALRIVPVTSYRARVLPSSEGDDTVHSAVESDTVPNATGADRAAAEAFDAMVARTLNPRRGLIAATYGRQGADFVGQIARGYEVTLNDDRIVSVTTTIEVDTGTRVDPTYRVLNFDLRRRQPLRLADLFRAGTDWRAPFRAAAERHFADPQTRDAFLQELSDTAVWSFGPDAITIRSGWDKPNFVTGDCAFCGIVVTASELRPFLRPDGPWRPR